MTSLALKESIIELENAVAALPQEDLPLAHYLIPGVYVRSIFIPKGVVLVGKIHNHESIGVVAYGDISIMTTDGVQRVQAPYTSTAKPGIKRVGYAHEDTVFLSIHKTEEMKLDLEKLELELVSESFEAFESRIKKL